MLLNDRAEMTMWLVRELMKFNPSLGDEAKTILLSDSPVPPTTDGPSLPRLKVIFLAGVEGTGHHGFMPMLLYPAIRAYGGRVLAWWRSLREVLLKTPPTERRMKLKKLLESMEVSNSREPYVIFEWCSWPFGEEHRERWANGCEDENALNREEQSGNPGNSVDLREFVDLFQEYGEVKILVLHRELVSAAWSHKEWDAGLVQHASVIALFNEYITGVVQDLSPEMWQWVTYEDISAAHASGNFNSIASIADFLGLSRSALERSFKYFRPSRKNASVEMPADSLQIIQKLNRERNGLWFSARFPPQQLLQGLAVERSDKEGLVRVASGSQAETSAHMGLDARQALERLVGTLNDVQKNAWVELLASQRAPEADTQLKMKQLVDTLSDDQKFLFQKASLKDQTAQKANDADVDPSVYTCLHMWLGGCGFGSEVNNLISAAIYCKQHGLDCVVEDENWNSGRLHGYFDAEPFILRRCHKNGHCRPLEVKRDRRVATPGWFAVCKHARSVSLQEKAAFVNKTWQCTPEAQTRIASLNQELGPLSCDYVAVQIRRGDKVAGQRRESLKINVSDYVKSTLSYCASDGVCSVVVVCTDDVSAAEELARELRLSRPGLDVRWRKRQNVVDKLRCGHWQAEWNARPETDRLDLTYEFLADVEVMREAHVLVCTFSSNVGRLLAVLREGAENKRQTVSLDEDWTNT